MPRTPPPVSSFAPEFTVALQQGALREIRIPLGDARKAMRLRFRLNQLRRSMRLEQHFMYQTVSRTSLHIDDKGDLILKPADSDFTHVMVSAGLSPPEVTPLPDENLTEVIGTLWKEQG